MEFNIAGIFTSNDFSIYYKDLKENSNTRVLVKYRPEDHRSTTNLIATLHMNQAILRDKSQLGLQYRDLSKWRLMSVTCDLYNNIYEYHYRMETPIPAECRIEVQVCTIRHDIQGAVIDEDTNR